MQAQQPHGKMLLLVDAVYKDISKQMCMDTMHKSTFSEKSDQRMSGSRFLYVMICSFLRSIIALHLHMMFFTFFGLFNYDQRSHVHW